MFRGMVRLGVVATLLLVAVVPAHAGFSITASDFSGDSSIFHAHLTLDEPLIINIFGAIAYGDADHDGFPDASFNVNYDSSLVVSNIFALLEVHPGEVVTHHSSGPVSTLFDWGLTLYEEPVAGGPSTPLGTVMYGYATFGPDFTVMHVNEGLMWFDGLALPQWAGYRLSDFSTIVLAEPSDGVFTLTAAPAPGAAGLLCLAGLLGSRRRR